MYGTRESAGILFGLVGVLLWGAYAPRAVGANMSIYHRWDKAPLGYYGATRAVRWHLEATLDGQNWQSVNSQNGSEEYFWYVEATSSYDWIWSSSVDGWVAWRIKTCKASDSSVLATSPAYTVVAGGTGHITAVAGSVLWSLDDYVCDVEEYSEPPPEYCVTRVIVPVTNTYPWKIYATLIRSYSNGVTSCLMSDSMLGPLPPGITGTWTVEEPCENGLASVFAVISRGDGSWGLDTWSFGGDSDTSTNAAGTNVTAAWSGTGSTLGAYSQFTNTVGRANTGAGSSNDFVGVSATVANAADRLGKDLEGLGEVMAKAFEKHLGASSDRAATNAYWVGNKNATNLWWLGDKNATNLAGLTSALQTNLAPMGTNLAIIGTNVAGLLSGMTSQPSPAQVEGAYETNAAVVGSAFGSLSGSAATATAGATGLVALIPGAIAAAPSSGKFGLNSAKQLVWGPTVATTLFDLDGEWNSFASFVRVLLCIMILVGAYRYFADQIAKEGLAMAHVPPGATSLVGLAAMAGRMTAYSALFLMILPVLVALVTEWWNIKEEAVVAYGIGEALSPSGDGPVAMGIRIAWSVSARFIPWFVITSVLVSELIWLTARMTVLRIGILVARIVGF